MVELGVNIDHVATVRQARRGQEPDPVWAAALAELGGADAITIHLREDRRHIQDRDVRILRETVTVRLNLELACVDEIIGLACSVRPDQATLVPERREEVTTEGGLDVIHHQASIAACVRRLQDAGIFVSLFLDPLEHMIEAAAEIQVDAMELHTGQYALARGAAQQQELARLVASARRIHGEGIQLHAGHGLNYHNTPPVATIPEMRELNIGHAIVSRAILVGMPTAVREMKALISQSLP